MSRPILTNALIPSASGGLLVVALAGIGSACGGGDGGGANAPPEIDDLSAKSRSIGPGGETEVFVAASDPDVSGSALREFDPQLEAEWRVSGEGWSLDDDTGRLTRVSAPDRYESWTTLAVEVTDGQGASVTEQIELKTGQNAPPQIVGLEAVPNPVQAGGVSQLRARADDPRGDALSYAWSAPDGWSLEASRGNEVAVQAPDREAVRGRMTVTVSDEFGGEIERRLLVETADDDPPRINSISTSPPQPEPGGTTRVSVDASDPEGSALAFEWSGSDGWTIDGSGDAVTLRAPDGYGERGRVEVEVTDERDNTASGGISVSTETNDGPVIQNLYADRRQVEPGKTLQVTANAVDPNGDSLIYDWKVGSSDWSIRPNGDRATVFVPDEAGRSTTVSVEVDDGAGETAAASILVSVAPNRDPQIIAVSANPRRIDPGGTATLEASAADPEGGDLTYDWNVSSPWSIRGSGDRVTLEAPGTFGVQEVVHLTVEDPVGGDDRESIGVSTRSNGDPRINSLTANPPVLNSGGTSRVQVSAADPDGDSLIYKWSAPKGWSKSSTSKPEAIDVVPNNTSSSSGTVSVTVLDGNGGRVSGSVVVRSR